MLKLWLVNIFLGNRQFGRKVVPVVIDENSFMKIFVFYFDM